MPVILSGVRQSRRSRRICGCSSARLSLISSGLRQLWLLRLMKMQILKGMTIAAQGSGGKQRIVRRHDPFGMRLGERGDRHQSGLDAHVVAAEKIQAIEFICRYQAFDFVEYRQGI